MTAYAGACGPRGFAGFDDDDVAAMAEQLRGMKRMFMAGRRGGPGHGPGGHGGPGVPWRGFGPGMARWGFPFGDGGPRARAGRGDVRTAVLALLWEGPRHGYQMIQEIAERSEGAWKPSPGSIYPVLSALQDEGLVDDEKIDGRRVFSLTDAGRAAVEERAEEIAHVFDSNKAEEDADLADIRPLIAGVASATMQVLQTGSPEQVAAARKVLATARRELYLLLAEDDEDA